MNSKISRLLNKAKKLEGSSLFEDISSLENLGEKATPKSEEYKTLLNKVNDIIIKERGDIESEIVSKKYIKNEVIENVNNREKTNYFGIKMIGPMYFSSKDNYKKGFPTVEECAKHFNGKQL